MSEAEQTGVEKEASGAVSDTELDQIINEIQSLHVTPMAAAPAEASTPSKPKDEPPPLASSSAEDEPWLEETLAQLKDDEITTAATAAAAAAEVAATESNAQEPESKVISMPIKDSNAPSVSKPKAIRNGESNLDGLKNELGSHGNAGVPESALEMTIRGKMAIKLHQGETDRVVMLRFDSDCLHIVLSDGMEFKIPHKQAV